MKRDWTEARAKCEREGHCRVCKLIPVEAAHIIPRSRIPGVGAMSQLNIVPLCRRCHTLFDGGSLDLLPYLTLFEQGYAAELVGIAEAYQRITNERLAA